MLVDISAFMIGSYCLMESVSAAAHMHNGDRLCRMAKYLFSGVSGLYVILATVFWTVTPEMLLLITSVALGIWPRMVSRITKVKEASKHIKERLRL